MTLERKVPPDVIALALAGLMWLVSTVTPSLAVPLVWRVLVAAALFAASAALIGSARVGFARVGTTFTPTDPGRSSHLVTTGVYRFTRNPMYLGTLLALLAVSALVMNVFSLVLAAVFVPYMNRFQIEPEERILAARFGSAYEAYVHRVRRWV